MMRFVDEYRDPAAARALVAAASPTSPATTTSSSWRCAAGTPTRSTATGSSTSCPSTVELVHGPGCPVCVIPMGRVDDAIAVAETPGVIFTSFGDMMRVPGEQRQPARGQGARAPTCASCTRRSTRCASRSRRPTATSCSSRSGFETTAPSTALTLLQARELGVDQLQRVLQPRHDRPADQGDPRVARPAPRRIPRPRPRVDRRRATGRTGSCPSSTASRS